MGLLWRLAFYLSPVIIAVIGIGMASDGEVGSGLATTAAGAGWGALVFKLCWVPGWKRNQRATNA